MWGALAAGGIAERDRPAVRCANHSTNVRLWVTRRNGCNVRFWPVSDRRLKLTADGRLLTLLRHWRTTALGAFNPRAD